MSNPLGSIRSPAPARFASLRVTAPTQRESSLLEVGASSEYLEGLARAAEHLRAMHGGKHRWWVGHKRRECDYCSKQPSRLTRQAEAAATYRGK